MSPQATPFKVPPSSNTVSVRIIDTSSHISGIPLTRFLDPPKIGCYSSMTIPSFSFLIEHPSGRNLLFDLGVRKDIENFAPAIKASISDWNVSVKTGVREQLEQHGVDVNAIEGIVWSHHHWDHTGDPSTFPPSTSIIVGPGFIDAFTPGYPADPKATILENDYAGREWISMNFGESEEGFVRLGHFNAIDYFKDGSFYLLDAPGHTATHMCGLARVTKEPSTFIFMGADACHHGGEFRPSIHVPLPSSISPHPLNKAKMVCPGALFEEFLRDGDKTKPFFAVKKGEGSVAYDAAEAERTIAKISEADGDENVLVVIAHDATLLDIVDFFPKYANNFKSKGWKSQGRWEFLKDFIAT